MQWERKIYLIENVGNNHIDSYISYTTTTATYTPPTTYHSHPHIPHQINHAPPTSHTTYATDTPRQLNILHHSPHTPPSSHTTRHLYPTPLITYSTPFTIHHPHHLSRLHRPLHPPPPTNHAPISGEDAACCRSSQSSNPDKLDHNQSRPSLLTNTSGKV